VVLNSKFGWFSWENNVERELRDSERAWRDSPRLDGRGTLRRKEDE
jgi:hypothetical protein